jgi:hypothetical protein
MHNPSFRVGDIAITRDNVYTKCWMCGEDFTVNLETALRDSISSLYDYHLACHQCKERQNHGIQTIR